jgi:AraC-like DNA-binding protein
VQISTLHAQALLEGLRLCGHDAAKFAARAALAPAIAEGAFGMIDVAEFDRLCLLALDFTGDEAFGLHWGSSRFAQFDLGRSAAYSSSLGEALQRLSEFAGLLASRPEMAIDTSEREVRLTIHALAVSKRARRMRDEFSMAAMLRLFEHFQVSDTIAAIDFAHPAPQHAAAYWEVFKRPVSFGQPRTEIALPRHVLEAQNAAPNRIMMRSLQGIADTLLPPPASAGSMVGRLRLLIESSWPCPPKIRQAARLLGVSERTLHRSLDRENQAYSKLIQEAQVAKAERLLAKSTLSVKEVAAEVGFRSTTAFQRAFKRHTGITPSSARGARPGLPRRSVDPSGRTR